MFILPVDQSIVLKLLEPSFATSYFTIVNRDKEYLHQWLLWPKHAESVQFFEQFIEQSIIDYVNGTSLTCAITYHDEIVGNISFNSIIVETKTVEIGYWLGEKYQGQGIITKAVSALINYAFDTLDMQHVEVYVATENTPSQKICQRLGFSLIEILAHHENLHGKVVDHTLYRLTREQWATR